MSGDCLDVSKILFVLVHYEDKSVTDASVDSLINALKDFKVASKIIIFDNSLIYTSNSPYVDIIRPNQNRYYWGAIKDCLHSLQSEYLFIANNDIIFNDHLCESVQKLVELDVDIGGFLMLSNGGVEGYVSDSLTNKLRFSFWSIYFYSFGWARCINFILPILKRIRRIFVSVQASGEKILNDYISVDAVHGHAVLLKKKSVCDIEGNAPLWGEEMFLSCHRRKNGLKMMLCTNVVGLHQGSKSVAKLSELEKYHLQREAFNEAKAIHMKTTNSKDTFFS